MNGNLKRKSTMEMFFSLECDGLMPRNQALGDKWGESGGYLPDQPEVWQTGPPQIID